MLPEYLPAWTKKQAIKYGNIIPPMPGLPLYAFTPKMVQEKSSTVPVQETCTFWMELPVKYMILFLSARVSLKLLLLFTEVMR